jgi:hypothetical protein
VAEESWLMERVSDGLVGWVAFQQAARRSKLFLEYYLYPPVLEMAFGRGWIVTPQFPLPRVKGQRGASETFDFLFFRNTDKRNGVPRGLAAVEIKFVRKLSRNYQIADDARKLIKVDSSDLNLEGYGDLRRYIMVCGYEKTLRAYFAKNIEDKAFGTILNKIEHGKNGERYGWVRRSDAQIAGKPMVIVFKNRDWASRFPEA